MDVTARKVAGGASQRGERHELRSLVESMPGVPWTYAVDDPADWRPIYIAPQVEQLIGYTSAELMAEPRFFQRLVHPDDLERILALAAHSIRRSEPWLAEFRIITRDGRLLWLRSRGNPGRDDQDRPLLYGVWIDITAEREPAGVADPEPHAATRNADRPGAQSFGVITHADSGRYGCSFAGSTTEPSACWWFSMIAISVRATAVAVPFSVWSGSTLPSARRTRVWSRRAW